MDLGTVLGIICAFGLVFYSIISRGDWSLFVDIPSLFIVLGGTLGVTLINYSLSELFGTLIIVKNAFIHKRQYVLETISGLVEFAKQMKTDSKKALEIAREIFPDFFTQKGAEMVVDGQNPEVIKSVLSNELLSIESRHKHGSDVFITMGTFAPAFGLLGTLIGLIQMLRHMSDPNRIGPAMALAIITTFYGAVLANMVFLPISGKLQKRSEEECSLKELVIEGLVSIATGDNPRIVEDKLNAFIHPSKRRTFFF